MADGAGRCANCIRLKKDCTFFAVDQQPQSQSEPRRRRKSKALNEAGGDSTATSPSVASSQIPDMSAALPFPPLSSTGQMPPHSELAGDAKRPRTGSFSPPGNKGEPALSALVGYMDDPSPSNSQFDGHELTTSRTAPLYSRSYEQTYPPPQSAAWLPAHASPITSSKPFAPADRHERPELTTSFPLAGQTPMSSWRPIHSASSDSPAYSHSPFSAASLTPMTTHSAHPSHGWTAAASPVPRDDSWSSMPSSRSMSYGTVDGLHHAPLPSQPHQLHTQQYPPPPQPHYNPQPHYRSEYPTHAAGPATTLPSSEAPSHDARWAPQPQPGYGSGNAFAKPGPPDAGFGWSYGAPLESPSQISLQGQGQGTPHEQGGYYGGGRGG